MTDDTPTNVIALAGRRPPVTITPAPHLHVGFRARMSEIPGDPLPLVLDLEHQGEVVGEIARFTDTPEGHAAAQTAADTGRRVVELLIFHQPGAAPA